MRSHRGYFIASSSKIIKFYYKSVSPIQLPIGCYYQKINIHSTYVELLDGGKYTLVYNFYKKINDLLLSINLIHMKNNIEYNR